VNEETWSKAKAVFVDENLAPHVWSNEPGHVYLAHMHPYHKVLICLEGSIVFHTPDGDISLTEGDRLDLPPDTHHSATVGETGVTCMEAAR
jgi:quercetin dioxygenase-like cupin family protein